MIGKTFLRLERDFDMHVNYCRDESNAQEFLVHHDAARDFFEVSGKFFLSKNEKLNFPRSRKSSEKLARFPRHLAMREMNFLSKSRENRYEFSDFSLGGLPR